MKRHAVIIGACLLLGAVVNVAVAWWLAIRPAPDVSPLHCPYGPEYKFLTIARGETQIRIQKPSLGFNLLERVDPDEFEAMLPEWSAMPTGRFPLDEVNGAFSHVEFASGWPIRALRYEAWDDGFWAPGTQPPRSVGLLVIPDHFVGNDPNTTFFDDDARRTKLPLRPIAVGFLANTAVYAGAVWIILVGCWWLPLRVRRSMRVRRGCCVCCGYDLRGGLQRVCPECGSQFHTRRNEPVG